MKILVAEPLKPPAVREIEDTLSAMQAVVDGPIQAVYPFDAPVALICHEEGKLLGLPLNRALYDPESGELYDIIAGTFFLCGAPPEEARFTALTEAQIVLPGAQDRLDQIAAQAGIGCLRFGFDGPVLHFIHANGNIFCFIHNEHSFPEGAPSRPPSHMISSRIARGMTMPSFSPGSLTEVFFML